MVVDYGFGNLFSIVKAFKHLGLEVKISAKPKDIMSADAVVLPGVGAFGDGMNGLRKRGFIKPLIDFAKSGKPFMGICLGMQFLFDYSDEFGSHKGLGLIRGRVKKIPLSKDSNYKIPHIGWNKLSFPGHRKDWQETILSSTKEGDQVYFVHSFAGYPSEKKDILATTKYGRKIITAAVMKNSIIGTQFHPEKSGEIGLRILSEFIRLIKKQ